MVRENVGRLPVVSRTAPRTILGIVTRSDLLAAHHRRLEDMARGERRRQDFRTWGSAGCGAGTRGALNLVHGGLWWGDTARVDIGFGAEHGWGGPAAGPAPPPPIRVTSSSPEDTAFVP